MKASNASSAAALISAIQISCNARLAFGCWLFGNLAITFAVLCTQQRCSRVFGQTSPAAFQNPSAPVLCALAGAIGEADQFLAAFRRRADQHQDALLFVFEACLEMDAIGPDVDIALRRQIAPLPRGVFVKPTVLQPADGGCRQPGSIVAEQRRQSLGEVAGGDTLQVKDRQ